jgi:hypothetical protein
MLSHQALEWYVSFEVLTAVVIKCSVYKDIMHCCPLEVN